MAGLPPSLYLRWAPLWWGSSTWPPIGSNVIGRTNKIPAQIRFERSNPTGISETHEFPPPGGPSTRNALIQNCPNSFNPKTLIGYELPAPSGVEGTVASNVMLVVHDVLGREVVVLVNELKGAGDSTGLKQVILRRR